MSLEETMEETMEETVAWSQCKPEPFVPIEDAKIPNVKVCKTKYNFFNFNISPSFLTTMGFFQLRLLKNRKKCGMYIFKMLIRQSKSFFPPLEVMSQNTKVSGPRLAFVLTYLHSPTKTRSSNCERKSKTKKTSKETERKAKGNA